MSIENPKRKHYGVLPPSIEDEGLVVAAGSISFASGDNLTTEKKTDALSVADGDSPVHPDNKFQLHIKRPEEDTAGTLTIKVYNVSTIDGTNADDTLLASSMEIAQTSGSSSSECFNIEGLFIGDGTIKISATFATDSGSAEVFYKLFRF